jgi:hypothetical protein
MTNLEQAQYQFWDMYKDAHGFRPRGIDTSTWTLEDFDYEFADLGKAIERENDQRREDEIVAMTAFEARVTANIAIGAGDRETAIRWMHEAHSTNGDDEYLCYLLGLPYSFFRETV